MLSFLPSPSNKRVRNNPGLSSDASSDVSSDGVRKSTQARQRKVSYVFLTDPNFKASITLWNHNEMGLGQIGITERRLWVVSSWLAICKKSSKNNL